VTVFPPIHTVHGVRPHPTRRSSAGLKSRIADQRTCRLEPHSRAPRAQLSRSGGNAYTQVTPSPAPRSLRPRGHFVATFWPSTSKKAAPPPGEAASDLPKRGADGTRTHDPLQHDGRLARLAADRVDWRRLGPSPLWPGPRPRSARCDASTISTSARLSRSSWIYLARSFWLLLVHPL